MNPDPLSLPSSAIKPTAEPDLTLDRELRGHQGHEGKDRKGIIPLSLFSFLSVLVLGSELWDSHSFAFLDAFPLLGIKV